MIGGSDYLIEERSRSEKILGAFLVILLLFAEEMVMPQVFGEQPENMPTAAISGIVFDGKSYNLMSQIIEATHGIYAQNEQKDRHQPLGFPGGSLLFHQFLLLLHQKLVLSAVSCRIIANREDDFKTWNAWKAGNKEGFDCTVFFTRDRNRSLRPAVQSIGLRLTGYSVPDTIAFCSRHRKQHGKHHLFFRDS